MKVLPVCQTMCATCPFRDGSPYAYLVPILTVSALTESTRICHSTGSSAINRRTGKPRKVCRGARDLQLEMFHQIGFLPEPTDQAWKEAAEKIKTNQKRKQHGHHNPT